MGGSCRAVQTHGNALDAAFDKTFHIVFIEQGAVGGHDHAKADFVSIGGNIKDIIPEQRFAAGENNDGLPHLSDLVKKFERLFGGKFVVVYMIFGSSPAMFAGQITPTGCLPGHKSQGIVFTGGVGATMSRGVCFMGMGHQLFNSLATSMAE
jgi:hypothetical protein